MSLAVVHSRALSGMEALPVTVEVHLANGLPSLTLVGLPETEVKEARDRVRAAVQNAGFDFPARRITINLAPADLPKESGRFDLPMALGILAASGQIPAEALAGYEFAGELSLSGALRPIRGALAMTYAIARAGLAPRRFVLPRANAEEAALVSDAQIYPADSLLAVCQHFLAQDPAAQLSAHRAQAASQAPHYPDFAEVKGQAPVKRALEVAAAGLHSALLIGPPGSGKSMLAQRFAGLLPPMSEQDALEAAAVHSLQGEFSPSRWKTRPFRAPHHTASAVALVGGGSVPRPGEISLAHRGVLFLDELPEFDRKVLEVLREPLESGHIHIARAARRAEFPARFQLIAAMNPCPCGYHGDASGRCACTPEQISRYQGRLSGPLWDRIDVQVVVPALPVADVQRAADGEPSATIAMRVAAAYARQLARQGCANQALGPAEIDRFCVPTPAARQVLEAAMNRLRWSARAYHRVLKVARSVADLADSTAIDVPHVAEAVQYRRAVREM